MPDIQMCLDNKCPMRKRCYRYTAIPDSQWQSVGNSMRKKNQKKCKMFCDNAGRSKRSNIK